MMKKIIKHHTIGISGKSASGKSYFLRKLTDMLNKDIFSMIDLDGYHFHCRKERLQLNEFPEDLEANNIKQIITDIKTIKSGQVITPPIYNHQKGIIENTTTVHPKPIIFIEGLHTTLLNDLAKQQIIDFTIHINPIINLQQTWKVHRDVLKRGYDFNTVMNEIKGRRVFEERYIQPQTYKSDVLLNINTHNLSIEHFLLIKQDNKLIESNEINNLFHLKKMKLFKKCYFQISQKKNFLKILMNIDRFNLINKQKKTINNLVENSIGYVVQMILGLILIFMVHNHE